MNSLIDSYITKQLGNLEYVKEGCKNVWVNSDRRAVIMFINFKGFSPEIYLLDTIYENTYHMFSMDGDEEIQTHLLRWFNEHMGIKSYEVITFDNEGVDYIY